MNRITLALLVLLASPAISLAASDSEDFEKLLGKSAIRIQDAFTDFQKATVACICRDAGANTRVAGILVRGFSAPDDKWTVACELPTFNAEGGLFSLSLCADWELLTK